MAGQAVSFVDARDLTLKYYIEARNKLPLPMRDMPRKIVENQTLSINDIIAHIQSNTEIGQWLVGEYASAMELIING